MKGQIILTLKFLVITLLFQNSLKIKPISLQNHKPML